MSSFSFSIYRGIEREKENSSANQMMLAGGIGVPSLLGLQLIVIERLLEEGEQRWNFLSWSVDQQFFLLFAALIPSTDAILLLLLLLMFIHFLIE